MVYDHVSFEMRLRRLIRKHRAMARGFTHRLRPDGLLVVQPRRASAPISARTLVLFLAAFFAFKGFMIAALGPDGYSERVSNLSEGSTFERAGAWVMQIDPLAKLVSEQMGPVLR